MDWYLLIIYNDLEPELLGPFADEEERDKAARYHRRKRDPAQNDGLYPVEIDWHEEKEISINSYHSGFFHEPLERGG